jgi:hypothetical protein
MYVAARLWCAILFLMLLSSCEEQGDTTPVSASCTSWPESMQLSDEMSKSVVTSIVVLNPCNIIVGGYYNALTPFVVPTGNAEAFVMRLRLDGENNIHEDWRYVLSTGQTDVITHLELLDTEIRFLGWTNGVVPGQVSFGKSDIVIGSLSYNGSLQNISQLGDERPNQPLRLFATEPGQYLMVGNDDVHVPTNFVEAWEEPWLAAINEQAGQYSLDWLLRTGNDATDFYLAAIRFSSSSDLLLAKNSSTGINQGLTIESFDPSGNPLWTAPITPSPYDMVAAMAPLSNDTLLILGSTYLNLGSGSLGGADLFLTEMDLTSGNFSPVKQFGTGDIDWAAALVIHDNQLFVVSEESPDDLTWWNMRLTRLSLETSEILAEDTLYQGVDGIIKGAAVIGNQLVIIGAVKTDTGEIRGWLRSVALTNSNINVQ